MSTRGEPRTSREARLDALHERLAGAVQQLVSEDDWRRALEFAAKFRSRSFKNMLLICAQHLEAFEQGRVPESTPTYVAGFKQWQMLGRQVQKGQPGYMIVAPVTGRFATNTPTDTGPWRRLDRGEKPRPGEVVRTRMIGVRPAYVWDVSQTAGGPIPKRPAPALLEGDAPAGLWDGLAAQVEALGFEVLRVPSSDELGGADGLTNYDTRRVSVRTDWSQADQVSTLVHELAHVLMHDPADQEARLHRGIREVEAESVALMVGAAHGMDTSNYTIPYVSGWASSVKDSTPVEVVQATGERVRKTALGILDQLDTAQVGGGDPPGLTRVLPQTAKPTHPASPLPLPADRRPVGAGAGRGL